jgi:phospholipid/cholesterol/gamma-HCH transport system ATP-binding protein
MATADAYASFERVKKAFGGVPVIENLSLEIRRGEVFTLLGASGAGKSVLLKLLIGLLEPDSGRIRINGAEVDGAEAGCRLPHKVSMLFQSGALFDSLTVGENVAYPLRFVGRLSAGEVRDRVAERLEMVGLAGTEGLWPSALSGGMRKRVGLARAIAGDPEMILYDEPTTGLDPINTRRIDELLLHIRDRLGVTSVVVTHDLASAFMISDRLAMLYSGRVIAVLPPASFAQSPEPAVRDFLGAMPSFPPGGRA